MRRCSLSRPPARHSAFSTPGSRRCGDHSASSATDAQEAIKAAAAGRAGCSRRSRPARSRCASENRGSRHGFWAPDCRPAGRYRSPFAPAIAAIRRVRSRVSTRSCRGHAWIQGIAAAQPVRQMSDRQRVSLGRVVAHDHAKIIEHQEARTLCARGNYQERRGPCRAGTACRRPAGCRVAPIHGMGQDPWSDRPSGN